MWDSFVSLFLNLLLFVYKLVGNFGVAIILYTILIKLVLFPLMRSQMKSAKAMSELQSDPRYLDMMERYKNDKEKLASEQMKLYKEMGINPTGSCLPLLLQFPLIIALYQAIIAAIVSTPLGLLNLTQRVMTNWISISDVFPIDPNFLWMNLAAPERLHIPGLSFGIPVMAILVAGTTWLQTKLTTPTNAGGEGGGTGAAMSGMMNIYMPLMMGFLALQFASGLAIYFLVSNLFTIVQSALMGNLHWENLKPQKKKVYSKAERKALATAAAAKRAEVAAAAPKTETRKYSSTDDDDDIFTKKIDSEEFRHHKKPRKKTTQE